MPGRGALEERRLAYVAVTRARDLLLCSGYWWDAGVTKKRGPSGLLDELAGLCRAGGGEVVTWADEPADDDPNPLAAEPPWAIWPYDPLGDRRTTVEAAAALVGAARHGPPPDVPRAAPCPGGDLGRRTGAAARRAGRQAPGHGLGHGWNSRPGCRCPSW